MWFGSTNAAPLLEANDSPIAGTTALPGTRVDLNFELP